MHKNILIAGLAVALTAGVALAQSPPPAAPNAPRAGVDQGPPGPRGDGPGFRRGGPGGRFMRQPPTPQEIQQRNATLFARMDANRDGRVTFEEFRADMERQRTERQRQMFQRFSGAQDSFTLDQLNARALERQADRRRGRDGGPPGGTGRRGPPAQPAPPPAAR